MLRPNLSVTLQLLAIFLQAAVMTESAPQSLTPVVCTDAIATLSIEGSRSLVEGCDLGHEQLTIASNSMVLLRSVVFGGVKLLTAVTGSLENITLVIENCSLVGSLNAVDSFLGDYRGVSIANVHLSLTDSVMKRTTISSAQGGVLYIGGGGVLNTSIVLNRCAVTASYVSAPLIRCAVLYLEWISMLINVTFRVESCTLVALGALEKDLHAITVAGNRDIPEVRAASVRIEVISSQLQLDACGSIEKPAGSGVVRFASLSELRDFQLIVTNTVVLASAVGVLWIPVRSTPFTWSSVTIATDWTVIIEDSVFRLWSCEFAALVDFNSLWHSSVSFMNVSIVSNISGAATPAALSLTVNVVSANVLTNCTVSFVEVNLIVAMCLGQQTIDATSMHTLRTFAVAMLDAALINSSILNALHCNVTMTSLDGILTLNSSFQMISAFAAVMHIGNQSTSVSDSTIRLTGCTVAASLEAKDCRNVPAVLATASVVVMTSCDSTNITVTYSSIVFTAASFFMVPKVQRIGAIIVAFAGAVRSCSFIARDCSVMTATMADGAMYTVVLQLPPTMTNSAIHFSNVTVGSAMSDGAGLTLCTDYCSITSSSLSFRQCSGRVESLALVVSLLLPWDPMMTLSSSLWVLDTSALDTSAKLEHPSHQPPSVVSCAAHFFNTTWTLRQSAFSRFRSFLCPTGPQSVTVVVEGCNNLWEGRSLRRSDIGTLRANVEVVQGDEPADGRNCDRLASTATVSASAFRVASVRKTSLLSSAVSAASIAAGSTAALLSSVTTVSSSLQFLSQRAEVTAACVTLGDSLGADMTDGGSFADIASNPLQLSIGTLGHELSSAGGCIVSMVIAVAVLFVLRSLSTAVEKRITAHVREKFDIRRALELPGSLYLPLMFAVQPLIGASLMLVTSSQRSATTVVFGLCTFCFLCAMPLGYFCWHAVMPWRRQPLPLIECRRVRCVEEPTAICRLHRALFAEQWAWRVSRAANDEGRMLGVVLLESFGVILRSFSNGRQWYVAVEVSAAVLSGVITGVVASLPLSARCAYATRIAADSIQALLLLTVIGSVMLFRPYNTMFGNVLAVGNAVLATVSVTMDAIFGSGGDAFLSALTLVEVSLSLIPAVWIGARLPFLLKRSNSAKGLSEPVMLRLPAATFVDMSIMPRDRGDALTQLIMQICSNASKH